MHSAKHCDNLRCCWPTGKGGKWEKLNMSPRNLQKILRHYICLVELNVGDAWVVNIYFPF